jgi:hypothetical protein
LSQSKLQAEEERTLMSKEASWDEGEVASLRRKVETMHAAYRAQQLRNEELESKLQAQEERMLMPNQALKALSEEATWNKAEVARLRREVETMHAAYRAQQLCNEELECAMSLSEHQSQRRFEECLADAEDTHCWEVAKLHNLLMESMLEVKTKMEAKEAELEEHRAAQDKMQQDMTAAKETIAMLKMQSAEERSDLKAVSLLHSPPSCICLSNCARRPMKALLRLY